MGALTLGRCLKSYNASVPDHSLIRVVNTMALGQWLGLAIMVAMCVGLLVWIVYVMKKGKKDEE